MQLGNVIKTAVKYLKPLLPFVVATIKELFTKQAKELSKEEITSNNGIININEELDKINLTLKNQLDEIEKNVINKIKEQLNEYIKIAMTLDKYPEIRKNTIEKIKREIKRYENSLEGFLLNDLRKNISIDNSYLIKILKMENSTTKERMIADFIAKGAKNSLKNYSLKSFNDLSEISQNIFQEFTYLLEELEENITIEIKELEILENTAKNCSEKEKLICDKVLEKSMLESI